MSKLFVRPAAGLKVRHATHRRHIHAGGEAVEDATYYRRRINTGDLVLVPEESAAESVALAELVGAIERLDRDGPGHFTADGKPSLKHLADELGRRVTREEVDQALAVLEGK